MPPERRLKIEALYHAALDKSAGARSSFLAAECGSDHDLLRSVKDLLAQQSSGAPILDEGLLSDGHSLRPGARLGPYEIVAVLGAGGMGEVYRARDPRLHRDVAIKILPARFSSDRMAQARFEREARAVAAITHPNILAIFDVGTDQGTTYVVTELLEGETLRSRLLRGPIEWRKAAEIGSLIADGLAAAHFKRIVHRDVKPENVFITADGHAKVLDFGLALWKPALASDDPTWASLETQPGTIMGTVSYMSPEQVRGEAAGPPSDIFSLGSVLYEMLAGRAPFRRETPVQTMNAILEAQPSPLRESGRRIPADLDRIIIRCLEKNPADRTQSAKDLTLALQDIARAPSHIQPRPAISRRTALSLTAGLTLLPAGGAFYLWSTNRSNPVESIAVLPFVNGGGNPEMEYLSDGITESLINSLSQISNLAVLSRNSVFRYKNGTTDAQAAGRALHAQTVLTGTVARRGDGLSISTELIDVRDNRHLWGEQYRRGIIDILDVQDDISKEISEKLRLKLSGDDRRRLTRRYTENTEAYQIYLQGRYYWNKKTAAGFDKGIEYFEKAIHLDPNYAPAYAALANLYYNLANYNFAIMRPREAWAKAKAAAMRAIAIDDTLAAAHASLALIAFQWEWDWPGAEREFKRALELDPGSSSTYEPSPASTNHWYSHFLMCMGRTEESIRVGKRALELDPVDLAITSHQGWYFLWTREFDKAVLPLQQTIDMDGSFVVAQWYLGLVYEQQRAYPKAIAQFQNCVRVTQGRPSMVALLGHAYAAANTPAEARATLQELARISAAKYVPSYPVAAIYVALGEKDDAFAWLEKAYDERDAWMEYLKIDPRMDPVRSDARFISLLRRMKLAG